ncbi:ABC transporter permease [Rugosimonospora acidiphila]|uniref:Oligopeptide transport system permease protein OppC n=1 Tax=Rugosimonospora acidiphila TaxID=556531 RepID=A0ABP9SI51_9ACTN
MTEPTIQAGRTNAGSATGAKPVAGDPGTGRVEREFTVKDRSQLQQTMRRFLRHRMAVGSLVVFVLLVLFAFITPLLWKYHYTTITPDNSVPPSLDHPFGTDNLGHDMFAQVLRGLQQSIKVALSIALIATIGGTLWGVISGYYGGAVDTVLMRFADLVLTIPSLAMAAALANNFGGTWWIIAIILGGVSAPYVGRVVRGMVLSIREREYVEAARALGASDFRIMIRHLVPNAFAVVVVNATLLVASGILLETSLSFLGFGIQAPDTSLGVLITTGQGAVDTRPWLFYFPGLFIILVALTVNFLGDGLRDALDPQQTRQRR